MFSGSEVYFSPFSPFDFGSQAIQRWTCRGSRMLLLHPFSPLFSNGSSVCVPAPSLPLAAPQRSLPPPAAEVSLFGLSEIPAPLLVKDSGQAGNSIQTLRFKQRFSGAAGKFLLTLLFQESFQRQPRLSPLGTLCPRQVGNQCS